MSYIYIFYTFSFVDKDTRIHFLNNKSDLMTVMLRVNLIACVCVSGYGRYCVRQLGGGSSPVPGLSERHEDSASRRCAQQN